jgi:diaminohydroxyphosphoribosylaminopyrimidine deaminase/5-amino-6-(5-phosphoribosylamino)uracil reductase
VVDDRHMGRAIELAQRHRTHPNPRVGAVIVDSSGSAIGEGAHEAPGLDHAEVAALRSASGSVAGATMYVSLEPCTHHGRTPPCTDAIIDAGIATVVIGATDPDERVSGTGIGKLREAGINVVEGVMADAARAVDEAYFYHRETGRPLVTVKYAMTLDGAVAAADTTSKWITSESARADAHRLRGTADAVVIGAGTLRTDDPRLDVRIDGHEGKQPLPVVIAGRLLLPSDRQIWEREPLVVSSDEIDIPGGELVTVEGDPGRPDPVATCLMLAERGILDILVEGGPTIAGEWVRADVVSRGIAYLAAKLGGGAGIAPLGGLFQTIDEARVVSITGMRSLGPDIRVDFEI